MVYILIALGVYYALQNQPNLQTVRSFPLDDGSAVMLGYDRSNDPRRVSIWRTTRDGEYSWLEDLEDDFIPPLDNAAPHPIAAAEANLMYLLSGQTTPFDQRLMTIQAIDLENGEVLWTNRQQPTGDAAFISVHIWGGQLVTAHRAITDGGTRRLYLVGRNPLGGEMKWTKVYQYDPGLSMEELASAVTYLPGKVLVRHGQLELLEMGTGNVLEAWSGENPSYNGGWIFYRDSSSMRAFATDSLSTVDIFPIGPAAPAVGFSGFYNGFPIHYSRALGWKRLQGGQLLASPFNGSIPSTILPNCCNPAPTTTRPRFLTNEWTRYIPLFLEPNALDTIRLRYPNAVQDPDLSGVHFVLLDNASLSPAFIGKRLEKAPEGVFFSHDKYHYFLTEADGPGQRPLIVQIDGEAGTLTKAIRSSYDFRQLLDPRLDQPVGDHLWIASPRAHVALQLPSLEIGTASNDSISFEDATRDVAVKWGLEPGE